MKKNNHYKAMAIAALLGTVPLQLMAQKLQVIKGEVDCGRTGYEMPVTATFELKNKGGRNNRGQAKTRKPTTKNTVKKYKYFDNLL